MSGLLQEPDRALLADGSVVSLRELGSADAGALLELHCGLPADDLYLRFFGSSPHLADDFVARLVSSEHPRHVAIGTLMVEHLASLARRRGVRRSTADVLTINSRMVHDRRVRAAAPDRTRHVQPRVDGRQVRRERQRSTAVVGT